MFIRIPYVGVMCMNKRHSFRYPTIRIRPGFIAVCFITVITITILIAALNNNKVLPAYTVPDNGITIIIDPGHGGMDGGAVAYDKKTVEKDINLSIAFKLREFLIVGGYNVVMTREDDRLIYDEGIKTIKKQKTSDIKNRLKIINEHPEALFISIHQNKFTQSKYNGAQVFYGRKNTDSQILAQAIQSSFRAMLQPDNAREVKKTGKEIYLLYHSDIPSVMVECGFLSNAEECERLKTDEYQNEVAFVIYAGLSQYIEACKANTAEND